MNATESTVNAYHGLALSGGGFRASFFHIGVLARLAELDLLRPIERISTVSGGSIVGALYYLKVKQCLEEGRVQRDDYVQVVQELCTEFLAGAQADLRSRTFGGFVSNLRRSNSELIGELYEKHFYFRSRGKSGRLAMRDLRIRASGELSGQQSVARVPTLYLNATVLDTGQRWVFTPNYMGALQDEAGGSKLTRMLAREFAYEDVEELKDLSLGLAVAASACVPLIFPPVRLPLWPFAAAKRELGFELVDGGVVDNLGLGPLAAQEPALVSNASAASPASSLRRGRASTFSTAGRSLRVLLEKTQQAAGLHALARLGEGMTQISLGRLKESSERGESGIEESMELIHQIRTDLDSFTDWEAHALMYAGYRRAKEELRSPTTVRDVDWPFEWVLEELTDKLARKHLGASSSHLKSVRLLPTPVRENPLGALVLGSAVFGAWLVFAARSDQGPLATPANTLMTLGGFFLFAVPAARFALALGLSLGMAIVSWASLALRRPLLRLGRRPPERRKP